MSNSNQKIALIGASGFIGLRCLERWQASTGCDVRVVVRAPSSLAVVARWPVEWKIADVLSRRSLADALAGCDVCVHAALGDARQIVQMAEAAYKGCLRAGVRRLVWLSSASVHGQNPPEETHELSRLYDRHPLSYNNAKVRAEWALNRLGRNRAVEVVRLRPSVVYGPRSRWITDTAKDLHTGRASWIRKGAAVCNAIAVDNLVGAIEAATTSSTAVGRAFLVRDAEPLTWNTFLLAIAHHLGFDHGAFHDVEPPTFPPEKESLWQNATLHPAYAALAGRVPGRLKQFLKAVAKAGRPAAPPADSWRMPDPVPPRMTHEMSLLQQNTWIMPQDGAQADLGYRPVVGYAEAMRRSLEWLDAAGWGSSSAAAERFGMADSDGRDHD